MECGKTSRAAANCACGGLLYEDDAGWVYCVSSDALVAKPYEEPRHATSCARDEDGVWDCRDHCPVRQAQIGMFA